MYNFKHYPKFNKNKLQNSSKGTKTIFQVQHDFWKETQVAQSIMHE